MNNPIAIVLVAAPALVLGWTCGGSCVGSPQPALLCASVACGLGMLSLPQRRMNESLGAAQWRVWGGIVRDPFFWTALAFVACLAFPLFNVAPCPLCDRAEIDAGADPYPPLRWLPFCVAPHEHAGMLQMFVPSLLSALGVRHALGRSGKRAFFELLVWNGAALALFGFVQIIGGAQFPYWRVPPRPIHFFSVFGYPNMAGAFFAMNYVFALSLWGYRMEQWEKQEKELELKRFSGTGSGCHPILGTHYPVVAVALSFYAVLATLCRAAILLMVVATVLFVIYTLIRLLVASGSRRACRFRFLPVIGSVYVALCGSTFVYAPPEVERELASLTVFGLADRVTGKAQYHSRVATAIMRDFPLFGVGGWGYRHFCVSYMDDKELRNLQVNGGANVHNDYLQFLVEHGIVGFGLLVACVWLLVAPVAGTWRRETQRFATSVYSRSEAPSSVAFNLSPSVIWTLLGCLAVLVHAFGDSPLRSGAVLSAFFAALPAAAGFLPHDCSTSV